MFGVNLTRKKIVILGGGFAGLHTAILLNKTSSTPLINLDITLIDNKDNFVFYPFLCETLSENMTFDDITIRYDTCPDLKGINFIKSEIKAINVIKKFVEIDEDKIDFDILVVALGSKIRVPTAFTNKPNVFVFKDPLDVEKLKHQISYQFKRYHSLEDKDDTDNPTDKNLRDSILNFMIVGAGPSGIELSAKFSDFLKAKCLEDGIAQELTKIFLIDVNEKLLPSFGESTIKSVNEVLKKKQINLLLGNTLHKLEDNICVLIGKDKVDIPCGTVIWTGGNEFSPTMEYSDMNVSPEGKIITDEYLLSTHAKGVFAIGDNAIIEKNKVLKNIPQTFIVAVQQAYVCSYNIIAELLHLPKIPYNYLKLGEALTLGDDSSFVRLLGGEFNGKFAKWIQKMLYAFAYPGVNSVNKMSHKILNKAKEDGVFPKWL